MQDRVCALLGHKGRMVCGSKGQYRWDNPDNVVIFNSNLCTKSGKIWYGDIDITVEEKKLHDLAQTLQETIYVLYETDARFENETNPLLENAVFFVDEKGHTGFNPEYFLRDSKGRLIHQKEDKKPEDEDKKKEEYLESEICQENLYEKTDFKIPWRKIQSLNREKCPVIKFWEFTNKHFEGVSNEELFKKVKISKHDNDKLGAAQKKWIEKYFDFLSDYKKESELSWSLFLYAPDYFMFDPNWIVSGFAYFKKKSVDAADKENAA